MPSAGLWVAPDCAWGHKWLVRRGLTPAGGAGSRQLDVGLGEDRTDDEGPRPKAAFAIGGCDGWSDFHQGSENFVVVPVISPVERRAGK